MPQSPHPKCHKRMPAGHWSPPISSRELRALKFSPIGAKEIVQLKTSSFGATGVWPFIILSVLGQNICLAIADDSADLRVSEPFEVQRCIPPQGKDEEAMASFELCLRVNRFYRLAKVQGSANPDIHLLTADDLLERSVSSVRISWPSAVFFDVDSDVLREEAKEVVRLVAEAMKRDVGDLHLFVIGHTDDTGTLSYNMDLSERRARNVLKVLSRLAMPIARMTAAGMGEAQPAADNHTARGRAANRRVEFMISEYAEANYRLVEERTINPKFFVTPPQQFVRAQPEPLLVPVTRLDSGSLRPLRILPDEPLEPLRVMSDRPFQGDSRKEPSDFAGIT